MKKLTLGEMLLLLRRRNGNTQNEVCVSVGISRNLLSQLENGNGNPTLNTLRGLAEFYGVTIGELLGEVNDERN